MGQPTREFALSDAQPPNAVMQLNEFGVGGLRRSPRIGGRMNRNRLQIGQAAAQLIAACGGPGVSFRVGRGEVDRGVRLGGSGRMVSGRFERRQFSLDASQFVADCAPCGVFAGRFTRRKSADARAIQRQAGEQCRVVQPARQAGLNDPRNACDRRVGDDSVNDRLGDPNRLECSRRIG